MVRLLLALAVLVAPLARAETLVPVVADAPGVPDAAVKKVERAVELLVRSSVSVPVAEGPPRRKGAPRRCDEACAQALARELDASLLLLVELKASDAKGEKVLAEVSLWRSGERQSSKKVEGLPDGAEAWLRPAVDAVLPGWMKRGFGALRVEAEPGSVVKVDGRVVTLGRGEVLALTAGLHAVDVISSDGDAVLRRVEVVAGERKRFEATPLEAGLTGPAAPAGGGLRATSYAVWMTGAAAIAGGLVAGALAKNTAAGLVPCRVDSRDCASLDAVLEKNRQAQSTVATGNILLGVGAGLAAVGAGLFVIDVATP